ncbi:MAG TPA: BON domain-containing protein, partial [Rhodothermia bacterium]|nr:BON domain-containing protein [Rhodothermia bacterium]
MSPFRYHDEESTATGALYIALGALAGFAAGVVVAQHYGGVSGLSDRIREKLGRAQAGDTIDEDTGDYETLDDDHERPLEPTEELEERVLEAFRNDPILSERAIDIGALDDGIVELTGWVNAADEAEQAVVITRGVPGVDTVVNRLAVRTEEDLMDDLAEDYDEAGPGTGGGQWEGQSVGTGRRRQGNSSEVDRHGDPRQELQEKELERVFLNADEEADIKAERRQRAKKPPKTGRADGSPVAPGGVPKSDHVAKPLDVRPEEFP